MTQLSDETIKKLDEIVDHAYNAGISVKERVKDEIISLVEQEVVKAREDELNNCLDMCEKASLGETYQVESMINESIAELKASKGE